MESGEELATNLFHKFLFIAPSLLTAGNIFCGFYSIIESIEGTNQLSTGNITQSAVCFDRAVIWILYSLMFDFLDGRLARFVGSTSEFGLWLDTIADMLSFGIAPSVLIYSWGRGQDHVLHKLFFYVSFMFIMCGALRLARFNVQSLRRKKGSLPRNSHINENAFIGMPITAGAAMIMGIVHSSPTPLAYNADLKSLLPGITFAFDGKILSLIVLLVVAGSALLMISTILFPSFKNTAICRGSSHLVAVKLLLLVILFLICRYSKWGLMATITTYIVYSSLRPRWR